MTEHPQVRVELREMIPDLLPDAVLTGRFDAAVTFDPGPIRGLSDASDIRRKALSRRAFRPFLHRVAEHPRRTAGGRALDRHAAGRPAPTLRDAILRFCRSGGITPTIRLEAQLQQTIVSLVAEELGVALVPTSMSRLGLPDVVFLPLEAAPTVAHVIAWRDGNLNPTLRPFLAAAGLQKS